MADCEDKEFKDLAADILRDTKTCEVCEKILCKQNYERHIKSPKHLLKMYYSQNKPMNNEPLQQPINKKRKHSEEYSSALNLMTSLKEKNIKISEMG